MAKTLYTYNAVVLSVYDGDTFDVSLDLGFHLYWHCRVRLAGCNAREHSDPGGPEARAHLLSLVPVGSQVVLTSVKLDSYADRIDALVESDACDNVTTQMIVDGYAAAWDGRGARPIPPWPIPLA